MGGGGSKSFWGPAVDGFVTDPAACPALGIDNYHLVVCDGKETDSHVLDGNSGTPIVVGRSSTQGSTIKSADDHCSSTHLEIKWNGTAWVAKDLNSSRGSKAYFGSGEMIKLEGEVEWVIPGPCCIHLGEVTFLTFLPKNLKSVGLTCTLNEMAEIDDINQGQFMEINKHVVFGRNKDAQGRKSVLLRHENISGAHTAILKPTGGVNSYPEIEDLEATHKTVVKHGDVVLKMKKCGTIVPWPGCKMSFGHKEKTAGQGKLEFTVGFKF